MSTVAEGRVAEVGQARPRREDAHLLTGRTQWTDNITLPGMLHLAILRSPVAHATITKVDVSAARERPGVVAAFSGGELADEWGPLPMAWTVSEDQKTPPHFPLTADKVRFAGDGIAVVAATSREAAVDALEAIDFDLEPLPAVVDMEAAMADGSALVYDDVPANRCFTWQESHGDYAAARERAEVVLKRRFVNQRLIPSAMEPRSVVVQPSPATSEYTLWSSTQVPHFVQIFISLTANVPQSSLRVIAPDVGGGFGSKLDVYAEEAIGVVLAKKLGVPVKWTETRSENCQVTIHGRDLLQDVEITAMRDGTVLGLKVDLIANMGAYLQLLTPCIPLLGRYMYPGIYKFEAHDLSCTGVFTNKTPTDAYRGAGRPEATYVIERIMDELANELGVDPLDLRRQNWIERDEFPFTTVAGLEYDSGDYEKATARAIDLLGYEELRREQQARRDGNDPVQIGIGVSTYTEMCGLAPSRWLGREGYIAGGWEAATVRVLPTGQGGGGHRHFAARPGARDHVRPNRRRRTRCSLRRRRHRAWRYPHSAARTRYLRLPLAGCRRDRHRQGLREDRGKGPSARRTSAGGRCPRRRVRGRPVLGARLRGAGQVHSGTGLRIVRRTRPASRRRSHPDRRCGHGSGDFLVPARHPPCARRGRHGDRQGRPQAVRRSRRRRKGRQSPRRRRPGSWWRGTGNRPGTVRRGGLRRRRAI